MKTLVIRLLLVVGIPLTLGFAGYFGYSWYFRYLNDRFNGLIYTSDYARRKDIDIPAARAALHRILGWPYHGEHDAFLSAAGIGDYTTVPLLIEDLKRQEYTPPGKPMDCEKAHCLNALRLISGVNAGVNYEDWIKWWDAAGKRRTSSESYAPTMQQLRWIEAADRAYQGVGKNPKRPPLPIEGLIEALSSTQGKDGEPFLPMADPARLDEVKMDQWGTSIRLTRNEDGKLMADSAGPDRQFGTEDDLPPRRRYGEK